MRVAVVIPLFDAAEFVTDTIASVRAQTHADLECIVVDDGSRDDGVEVVRRAVSGDPRFRLLGQPNAGAAAARNRGLQQVSADVEAVAFLDADDLWLPDALEVLVRSLSADPSAAGAYGTAELVDAAGAPIRPGEFGDREQHRRVAGRLGFRAVPADAPFRFEEAVTVSQIWPPAMALHRRAVVDAVGGFDAAVRYTDDWDLLIRTTRHGHYTSVCRQVVWYRVHGGQLTSDTSANDLSLDVVRRKTWESPVNTTGQRRAVLRAWRNHHLRRSLLTARAAGRSLVRRDWSSGGRLAVGTVWTAAELVRRSPPRPSARRNRLTAPSSPLLRGGS